MSNWNGKTIGNVQIGEFIARGGMAEVYLGEHKSLNRKVAVKIMRDHVEHDPDTRLRFEREARVVAGLRHPNIIQMFDYDLVEGQPCLIMEYVPGATLANYLKALHARKEKLPPNMIARIISALAAAIDYAHSHHIVHRDIKPANVMLRSASGPVNADEPLPADVEPILTDFGLVRLLDSSIQTSSGTVSGTPAYMSPEQARGDKVSRKSDIYSLGVILYEMLAGAVPFEAESSFGVLMKHINESPPLIFGISPDLQAIINRALAKDEKLRYPSATEMAEELTAVLNGQRISKNTAGIAKHALESSKNKNQTRSFNWIWAGFFTLILIGASFIAFRSLFLQSVDKDKPVGRVVFSDQNALMDKISITLGDLPALKAGSHYEVWLLAGSGEIRRNIGILKMDESDQGQLVYTNPDQENILSLFDQIEVTIEPDNDPAPDRSSADIAASSVFPALALVHVRHILTVFEPAPQETALIQGLWGAADGLYTSVDELQEAFANGNEEIVRKKNEEIINQLTGNMNTAQYLDWNSDGKIDDPYDGFGLLQNGDPGYNDQGYISQTASHAQFARQAADATENIKIQSANLVFCLDNMKSWSEQLLTKALQLQAMSFGPEMKTLITDMTVLTNQIISGVDSNGNALIEPIIGEGGATTAYEYAYYLAEMALLPGSSSAPKTGE
ncbi:MAG: protein kinase [Anaerolineales bacterium]|nr:protein kinase [Anaerolineales bacterium]